MTERCTGHCCRGFTLSAPVSSLPGNVLDGEKILDMIEPAVSRDGAPRYNCRHHDEATGDCRIYADRPKMCVDYPYREACSVPNCTLKELCRG